MEKSKKAILLMLSAQFSFSIMDLFVKVVVKKLGILETVFFRGLFTMFVISIYMYFSGISFGGKNKKLLILRGIAGFLGLTCYVFGINYLKLADAVLLNRSSPIFVVIFSFFLLGEKIYKKQIIALVIAFLGVINIIKPEMHIDILPGIIGLLSALFSGIAYIIVKKLSYYNSSFTIVFYFTLVTTTITAPMLPFKFIFPESNIIIVLFIIGITSALAQILMTLSYKNGEAGKVSIVSYASVLFSAIWGYIFFGELQDVRSILGGIMIIVSCILLSNIKKEEVKVENSNHIRYS